jgi:hypothetical protein
MVGNYHIEAAWDIESCLLDSSSLDQFGGSQNMPEHCFNQLLHIVCARIEREPDLCKNVKTGPDFCVITFERDSQPDLELRKAAREYADLPVRKYFEVT